MTLEERVAYLEGRGEEHAAAIGELRLDVRELRTDVRDLRAEMIQRFEHMDTKFDAKFDRMDAKFAWLIGFQFAGFLGIIAALLRR